jgi:hypothetical protein
MLPVPQREESYEFPYIGLAEIQQQPQPPPLPVEQPSEQPAEPEPEESRKLLKN